MKQQFRPQRIFLPAVLGLLVFLAAGARQTLQAGEDLPETMAVKTSQKAFMGVVPRKLDHVLRAALDFEKPGVLLAEIVRDTAAEEAGLELGDILLSMDGIPVHDPDRLMSLMKKYRAGDEVQLEILRKGKTRTLTITMGSRPVKAHFFGDNSTLPHDWRTEFEFSDLEDLEMELKGLELDLEGLIPQIEVLSDEAGQTVNVLIERHDEERYD